MLRSNVVWVALSQIIRVACNVLTIFFLSRLLSPTDIGLISMAMVVINFIAIIRDLGTSAAVIQHKEIDEDLRSSVFWLNLIFGIVLAGIIIAVSPLIASFFNAPPLIKVLDILAISLPIYSITSTNMALLERDSQFKQISFIEIVSTLASLILALYMAYEGYGVYSLVGQTILQATLSAIMLVIASRWLPKFILSKKALQSIFGFTSNLVFFNIVNYFARNLDQIVIGRFFAKNDLGIYTMGYRIMLFPVQNITAVLTRSLFPLLSRLADNKAEAFGLYQTSLRSVALLIPIIMCEIAAVHQELVAVTLGSNWTRVAILLVILAPTAILQAFVTTTGTVFMSQGKSGTLFRITVFNTLVQCASFLLGILYNIDMLAIFYGIANLIIFIPNMSLASRTLGGTLGASLKVIYGPILLAIGCGVLSYLSRLAVPDSSALLRLCIGLIVGVGVYYVMFKLLKWQFSVKKVEQELAEAEEQREEEVAAPGK